MEQKEEEKEKISISQEKLSVSVAITAITASLYIALGYIFQPISFYGLQFRVAELMLGMVMLFPKAGLIGKIIGVFFVNLSSPMVPLDLLSCLVNIPALTCIILTRDWKFFKYIGATVYAFVIAVYVAWLVNLYFSAPFILNLIYVFISEEVLACLSVFLFTIIGKTFTREQKLKRRHDEKET
ncbi:MAG: QueT transporter family protein [Promethearchaeota archaeon]